MREVFENFILPILMGMVGCGIGLFIAHIIGVL